MFKVDMPKAARWAQKKATISSICFLLFCLLIGAQSLSLCL